MGFRTEKFGPPSPNTPDFPSPKGSPGGNDTHETCMNELEKCMNFSKNLDFTLPTSIGGFRGPGSLGGANGTSVALLTRSGPQR
jgi:hypothetical protein